MFSQPSIKRVNMTQPYMPMQHMQSNMPMYNPNNQMDYSNSYQSMNDNMSYYSSASTATNLTNNFKKKNFLDEFNSVLNNCITSLLPKIAEECADLVFSKISSELDKQSKEIDELKSQLTQFENIIKEKLNLKIFNIESTPYKNLRQVNGDLSEINSLIADQSVLLKEYKSNGSKSDDNSYHTIFDCLNKKISNLKGEIDEERKMAEKLNSGIRDRYVDLLGIKNMIDDKINYMISDLKIKSTNDNRFSDNSDDIFLVENEKKMFELINMVDVLYEKINNNGSRKEFSNLEIQNSIRDKPNFENNFKSNFNGYLAVTPVNQKLNLNKENISQGNFNFTGNSDLNFINSTGIVENSKSSNKGRNSAMNPSNVKKQNKRINISHKFTF